MASQVYNHIFEQLYQVQIMSQNKMLYKRNISFRTDLWFLKIAHPSSDSSFNYCSYCILFNEQKKKSGYSITELKVSDKKCVKYISRFIFKIRVFDF